MYKTRQPVKAKPAIPTPATATVEQCQAIESTVVAHYTTMFTPELMIAHRSGCYATVINTTIDGQSLATLVGTDNAKLMTENVLNTISARFSAITTK